MPDTPKRPARRATLPLLAAALLPLAAAVPAQAADYRIDLYLQAPGADWARLDSYSLSSGHIAVRDAAVQAGGIALFNTPDVTAFAVDVQGATQVHRFRLADDIFPPLDNTATIGWALNTKGLRFGADGAPLYFDMPAYFSCTRCAAIIDTDDGAAPPAALEFIDNGSFFSQDHVFASDGLLYQRANLPSGLVAQVDVAGEWRFDRGAGAAREELRGLYTLTQVSAVPEPQAWLLMAGGLAALAALRPAVRRPG